MELLTILAENWQEIVAGGIVALASGGKLAEMLIKTVGNVRDQWVETFPTKNPWEL